MLGKLSAPLMKLPLTLQKGFLVFFGVFVSFFFDLTYLLHLIRQQAGFAVAEV